MARVVAVVTTQENDTRRRQRRVGQRADGAHQADAVHRLHLHIGQDQIRPGGGQGCQALAPSA
jgi:hypothetical protein